MMSTSFGCLPEPATGFAGSSTTMALSSGFACASASDSQSSSVYWSNSPHDRVVVSSTALGGHGGGCMTCLVAACFAASFHIIPVVAFSDHCLVNGLITSVTHSEVRPAFLLSQWRTVMSLSIPSFHLGHVVGALNRIHVGLYRNVRINDLNLSVGITNPRRLNLIFIPSVTVKH